MSCPRPPCCQASILNKIQSSKLSDAACPDGFVILTAAFEKAVGTHLQDLHELQGHLDAESVDEHKVEELLRRLRTAMLTASLPHAVTRALADFTHDVRNCAVRSSAVGEDSAASAFAGLFESKLHVPSKLEAMEAAVREVWASAFTLRAAWQLFHMFLKRTSQADVALQHVCEHTISGLPGSEEAGGGRQRLEDGCPGSADGSGCQGFWCCLLPKPENIRWWASRSVRFGLKRSWRCGGRRGAASGVLGRPSIPASNRSP